MPIKAITPSLARAMRRYSSSHNGIGLALDRMMGASA
jgi:hypothetical protein